MNKPWSQYVCCLLVANRDWARRNPAATKRVTRAVLRAADAVAKDKVRAAHEVVVRGYPQDEQIVYETMEMLSYDWRDIDPEDTLRFFALKLSDVMLSTSTPKDIIAQDSDFAYMRQLRKELTL